MPPAVLTPSFHLFPTLLPLHLYSYLRACCPSKMPKLGTKCFCSQYKPPPSDLYPIPPPTSISEHPLQICQVLPPSQTSQCCCSCCCRTPGPLLLSPACPLPFFPCPPPWFPLLLTPPSLLPSPHSSHSCRLTFLLRAMSLQLLTSRCCSPLHNCLLAAAASLLPFTSCLACHPLTADCMVMAAEQRMSRQQRMELKATRRSGSLLSCC